jgi:cytochrome c oxidase accessory protein FixG
MVCPYGRLQGVLLDANSIVVAYDFRRGDPKGKLVRNQPRKDLGDCIECRQCVEVCPTGIDIRNGTQLECINCTACIDACNTVMKKLNWPKGLIRYASYNGIIEGSRLRFTPRVAGYSAILLLLLIITSTFLIVRSPLDVTVLRTPGLLYQQTEDQYISNLYNLKIINKSHDQQTIGIRLKTPQGRIKMIGGDPVIPQGELAESAFFVEIPADKISFARIPILLEIYSNQELLKEIRTSFLGPERGRGSK